MIKIKYEIEIEIEIEREREREREREARKAEELAELIAAFKRYSRAIILLESND